MGVHPLDKLLHFTKYEGKNGTAVSYIASIDFYRMCAMKTRLLDGIQTKCTYRENGKIKGAKARVHRKDMKYPVETEVLIDEYSTGRNLWTRMPSVMIKKCAEAAALRQAFPDALHGVYTSEEMEQAGSSEPREYIENKKHTPEEKDYSIITFGKEKGKKMKEAPTEWFAHFFTFLKNANEEQREKYAPYLVPAENEIIKRDISTFSEGCLKEIMEHFEDHHMLRSFYAKIREEDEKRKKENQDITYTKNALVIPEGEDPHANIDDNAFSENSGELEDSDPFTKKQKAQNNGE